MYSRSSWPYRNAGSARTCGGIAMLIRGAPVGMSCVVIVGVIRLTGTSWCLLVAGLETAGVRGLGGAWMMRPIGSGVLWPLWVCGRGSCGGSVDGECGESVVSLAVSPLSGETGEGSDGETECVVSGEFEGGVEVEGMGVVGVGAKGFRSAVHCRMC